MSTVKEAILQDITKLRNNCNDERDLDRLSKERGFLGRVVHRIFGNKERDTARITKLFISSFDTLDFIPTRISEKPEDLVIDHTPWLETANRVQALLAKSKSKQLQSLGRVVELRRLGLEYRLDKIKKETESDASLFDQMRKVAEDWKKKNKYLPNYDLTDKDIKKFKEMCQYKEFCTLLLKDKFSLEDFFKWAIRDSNDVDTYVQFAGARNWLSTFVTKRTRGLFKIEMEGCEKKLKLPFEGKDLNILNRQTKVNMGYKHIVTIEEIVKSIKNKNNRVGDFEFYTPNNRGFINFNIHELGPYNAKLKDYERIDLDKDKWWEDLPLAESYTLGEAKEVFGTDLNGENWSIAVMASRTDLTPGNRNIDGTHGYLCLAIPTADRSNYQLYYFGKFAKEFPNSVKKLIKFIGNSVNATIALDENFCYNQRQKTRVSYTIAPEHGKYAMDLIAHSIRRARNNLLVFQFNSNGCGKWVQAIFNKVLKHAGQKECNVFRSSVMESTPKVFPVNILHGIVKKFPKRFQAAGIRRVLDVFAPKREYRGYSLEKSRMYRVHTETYIPSTLFTRQEDEVKKGRPSTILPSGTLPAFLREAIAATP